MNLRVFYDGDNALLTDYFEEVYQAFVTAEQNTHEVDRYYGIADHTIRLCFAGDAMLPHTLPAFEHLAAENIYNERLTICIWDTASTHVHLPPFPSRHEKNETPARIRSRYQKAEHVRVYLQENGVQVAYEINTKMLSLLDNSRNLGIVWARDASELTYHYRSSPLRSVIQWWAKKFDLLLVHASAIGNSTGGVLFVGKSGSGKSCTAMSALNSKLFYAGDDHVLIQTDPVPFAYSIYNSLKLYAEDVECYPEMQSTSEKQGSTFEKVLFFLQDLSPEKISKGFPLKAIILPEVTNALQTRITKLSAPEMLRSLAPSTIFQLPGSGSRDLRWMASLVKLVPGFKLELGHNRNDIADVIMQLIT